MGESLPNSPNLSRSSRALHHMDRLTTHPAAAGVVAAAVISAFGVVLATGFSQTFQVAFATLCGGISVTMLFVLQHTQRRAQVAIQLKLDEIVRALPQADNRAVRIEVATAEELRDFESRNQEIHDAVRNYGDEGDGDEGVPAPPPLA